MKTYIKQIMTALLLCFVIAGCQDNENWRIIPYEPEPEVPSDQPAELRIAGSHQGWAPDAEVIGKLYPVKNEAGEMAGDYAGYVYLGTEFKICPNASWDDAYGASESTPAGSMETGEGLGNLTVEEEGYYYVTCNINDLTWNVKVMNWGAIGDFNSWAEEVPLTYDAADLKLKAVIEFPADGGFKFRANNNWDEGNIGGTMDELVQGSDSPNIPVTAGTYQVVLDLSNPTYTVELIAQ